MLQDLRDGARRALGANVVGAYHVGSFALGHGDEHSDVDFLVVLEQDVDEEQERALRTLHARLPDSRTGWARHLEGSYVPRADLRGPGPAPRDWLYVDNGSRDMEWSAHDDTAATRWVMREHGIVIDGPDPRSLVDPVPPRLIRQEAADLIERIARETVEDPERIANAWVQQYQVLTLCRLLYSVATGSVTAKVPGGRWAIENLDSQWTNLIRRAIADRPDPWGRVHRSADAELLEPTRRFSASALRHVRDSLGTETSHP